MAETRWRLRRSDKLSVICHCCTVRCQQDGSETSRTCQADCARTLSAAAYDILIHGGVFLLLLAPISQPAFFGTPCRTRFGASSPRRDSAATGKFEPSQGRPSFFRHEGTGKIILRTAVLPPFAPTGALIDALQGTSPRMGIRRSEQKATWDVPSCHSPRIMKSPAGNPLTVCTIRTSPGRLSLPRTI